MSHKSMRLSQSIWSAFQCTNTIPKTVEWTRFTITKSKHIYLQDLSFHCAPQARLRPQRRFKSDSRIEDERKTSEGSFKPQSGIAKDSISQKKAEEQDKNIHTLKGSSSGGQSSNDDVQQPLRRQSISKEIPISLPSHSSNQPPNIRHKFVHYMDNFQSTLFTASKRLNDLTGYSGIEALKRDIDAQESELQESRNKVKQSRANYSAAIDTRSTTQREVNDLLQRKNSWSPTDLERFTNLYRSDHENEQAEAAAQREVNDAEARYEEASTRLTRTILARYHEEQIWSDKIRQMSTWGTWSLMGLNILLFVLFQIAIEPWRRRRLVKGFEEKVELALTERDQRNVNGLLQPNGAAAVQQPEQKVEDVAGSIAEQIVDAVTGVNTSSNTNIPSRSDVGNAAELIATHEIEQEEAVSEFPSSSDQFVSTTSGYTYYEEAFRELFSDRRIIVTQKDLTTTALEGAVGGAALMGLLLVLLRPK